MANFIEFKGEISKNDNSDISIREEKYIMSKLLKVLDDNGYDFYGTFGLSKHRDEEE